MYWWSPVTSAKASTRSWVIWIQSPVPNASPMSDRSSSAEVMTRSAVMRSVTLAPPAISALLGGRHPPLLLRCLGTDRRHRLGPAVGIERHKDEIRRGDVPRLSRVEIFSL